jgi:hypothetical protein
MHGSTEPACTASTLTTDSAGGGPAQTAEQGAGRAAGAERVLPPFPFFLAPPRRLFRFFAATQCRGRSPVYEALSEGVADSDALLDLLMSTPAEQRRPTLLLAAVSFLLAVRPGAPLAAYYPVQGGRRPPDSDLVPAFAAFCASTARNSPGSCAPGRPRPTRSAGAWLFASGSATSASAGPGPWP